MIVWLVNCRKLSPCHQAAAHKHAAFDNVSMHVQYLFEDLILGQEKGHVLAGNVFRKILEFVKRVAYARLKILANCRVKVHVFGGLGARIEHGMKAVRFHDQSVSMIGTGYAGFLCPERAGSKTPRSVWSRNCLRPAPSEMGPDGLRGSSSPG